MNLASFERYVSAKFGKFRKSRGKSGVEIMVCCPFCITNGEPTKDKKYKLSMNVHKGIYRCWRCDKAGPLRDIFGELKELENMVPAVNQQPTAIPTNIDPPGELSYLTDLELGHPAIEYLTEARAVRFDPAEVQNVFGGRYCHQGKIFAGMYNTTNTLIFPIFFNNVLVGWQSRMLADPDQLSEEYMIIAGFRKDEDGEWIKPPKYFTSPGFPKGEVVFNWDMAIQTPYLVIVEGVFDAMAIGPSGIATLGKGVTDRQIANIIDFCGQRPDIHVVIMLDDDAQEEAFQLQLKLNCYVRVTNVLLQGYHDAGDTPREEIWRQIHHNIKGGISARSKPADLMVIGPFPHWDAFKYGDPFFGSGGDIIKRALRDLKIDINHSIYLTNLCKYYTSDGIKDKDYKRALRLLLKEIEKVQPKVIITLGAKTLPFITGKEKRLLSENRGCVIRSEAINVPIIATWAPTYIVRQPEFWPMFLQDVEKAAILLNGGHVAERAEVEEYQLVDSMDKLDAFMHEIEQRASTNGAIMFATDAEWEGDRAIDLDYGYMRTLQLTNDDLTAVFKFYPSSTDDMFLKGEDPKTGKKVYQPVDRDLLYPDCVSISEVINRLKQFMQSYRVGIIGQNVKADGVWLLRYGLDIREHVVFDTMLVEHLISNIGNFSLEELTMKYTTMGRYDATLNNWKRLNEGMTKRGYGSIPDAILLPYAAGDTQATWKIFKAQMAYIQKNRPNLLKPRGEHKQYPSLVQSTISLQKHLYEFEIEGLPIDLELMKELTKIYNDKRRELNAQIKTLALDYEFEDFNPNSHVQVKELLFSKKGLGLTPTHSTGKKSKAWEWVMKQREDIRKKYQPSSDSKALEILSKQHLFPRLLLNYSRISKMCTGFLREDEAGGLTGMVWPDGRIHPEFGQLTDTGRLSSRYPNAQNWSKLAEIKMWEIFGGKKNAPPSIRTMIKAPPGCKIIEADFKQAELFVLAGLSGDEVMMGALTTPGKDLHDITTISSFNIKCVDAEGKEVDPSEDPAILEMAKNDPEQHESYIDGMTYHLPSGKVLSRGEFKKGLRTAGKAVNFGISYGRGAAAIATQIEVETGVKLPEAIVQQGIDGWKNKFKVAWAFIEENQQKANNPGYVENPWGRRRYFQKKELRSEIAANEREAGNFPIQSTVADCMALAAEILAQKRMEFSLDFKMINQIHDAFIFIIPEAELETTCGIIEKSMAVAIPLPHGGSLRLGVDIDVYDRWCA
jgi:uracil-DNA glycosylase family 4